jgi:hypothetical protein
MGGKSKGGGELAALKKQARDLAAGVLEGNVETSKAAVANQIFNTLIRAIEQDRRTSRRASSRSASRPWRRS